MHNKATMFPANGEVMTTDEMILIIGDDADFGLLIKEKLNEQGIKTAAAATGGEALVWLGANDASLILLDLNLPDITGRELISLLEKRGESLPFIVVSGMDDMRLTVEMMQLGALDFILKDAALPHLVAPIVMRGLDALTARRSLVDSQTKLRYICETIRDVFWMMDGHGERFLFVSPAFETIWGFPAKHIYESLDAWREAIVEEDRSKVLRGFAKMRNGMEKDFDEVYRIRDKLGKIRWIRDRGYANCGADNEILSFTGIATEITLYKELERQLLEVAERERIRIGEELHDNLCQQLAAIGLQFGIIHGVLDKENHMQAAAMEGAIGELQESTILARTIARGLSPVSLEAEGLMEGLRHFTQEMEGRFRLSCEFDCPEPVEVNNATTASSIFRIAQELVNNAAKHARPRRILVGLYNSMGGLRLEVNNDGKPFYGPKRRREGMGLRFAQFRADAIGAGLEFFPGDPPDGGTRVVCVVPFAEK